jgi:hypothetical protein
MIQLLDSILAPWRRSPQLFVFGNQKSGTSAIAGLLAAATGKRLAADFPGARHPFIGPLLRGETPITAFVRRNRGFFSAPIVKEPSLTFVAPALLTFFPEARCIFVLRNPWQNIRSILNRLDLRGDTLQPEHRSKTINPTWSDILLGADLGLPPDHFVSILAIRWLRAAEIGQSLGERAALVRYENFTEAKRETIAHLAAGAEFPVIADVASQVDHPFQPRGTDESPHSFFGPNLARIEAICGAQARALGYTP